VFCFLHPHLSKKLVISTFQLYHLVNISSIKKPWCTMVLYRRPKLLVIWLLLILFILGHCHGSRTTNVFKVKPKSHHQGNFFGSLPKRMHIPYSTPSRKHNDIGLKSWRSPWRNKNKRRWIVVFLDKGDHWFFFLPSFSSSLKEKKN
jgi:hypothetical protein